MYVDIATGTPYSESRRAWAIGSSAIVRGYSLTPPAGDWFALHMQMLAFNALELPGQAVLDAAAREYQALVGSGALGASPSGLTTGSSVSVAESLAAAAALVVALALVLCLCRRGVRSGTARRARPREWSAMLETLPDAPSEGSRAAAVVL